MIDVKQAIRTARDFFVEAYESANFPLNRLLLEGVERTEDDKYWLVTFGFDVERPIEKDAVSTPSWGSFGWEPDERSRVQRSYHTVWVRAEDGIPEKMSPG